MAARRCRSNCSCPTEQHDVLIGKVLTTIAGYAEAPDAPADSHTRFDAVLGNAEAGNALKNAAGTVDIKADLKDTNGIELSDQAVLRQVSSTGPPDVRRGSRLGPRRPPAALHGSARAPAHTDGFAAHAISVYEDYPDAATRQWNGLPATRATSDKTRIRRAPSWPRISISSPFRIWSACSIAALTLQARARPVSPARAGGAPSPQGFRTWLQQNSPIDPNAVVPNDPYLDLSLTEREDYREHSYVFRGSTRSGRK